MVHRIVVRVQLRIPYQRVYDLPYVFADVRRPSGRLLQHLVQQLQTVVDAVQEKTVLVAEILVYDAHAHA